MYENPEGPRPLLPPAADTHGWKRSYAAKRESAKRIFNHFYFCDSLYEVMHCSIKFVAVN